MKDANNALGSRGEAIFHANMLSFHGRMPLFRVHFLGDKWPLVDFICELEGSWKRERPFFFVQVKATRAGYTPSGDRLRVRITRSRAVGLSAYKAPVYLVGINAEDERAFVVGIAGRNICALSSLHCGTELDAVGRQALWKEVRDYWAAARHPRRWTSMYEPNWR